MGFITKADPRGVLEIKKFFYGNNSRADSPKKDQNWKLSPKYLGGPRGGELSEKKLHEEVDKGKRFGGRVGGRTAFTSDRNPLAGWQKPKGVNDHQHDKKKGRCT